MPSLPRFERALAALPDAVTASAFLALWLHPLAFGASGVRNGMLVMLVEFILIHSSAFLTAIAFAEGTPRAKRLAMLAGAGLLYLVFIGAFSLAFHAWWPFFAFGWLLLGKAAGMFGVLRTRGDAGQPQLGAWALSVLAYLGAVFATTLLPLPRLGIAREVLASLQLPGSGLWVEQPHRVIAAGAFYFGVLAWAKWRGKRLPAAAPPQA